LLSDTYYFLVKKSTKFLSIKETQWKLVGNERMMTDEKLIKGCGRKTLPRTDN